MTDLVIPENATEIVWPGGNRSASESFTRLVIVRTDVKRIPPHAPRIEQEVIIRDNVNLISIENCPDCETLLINSNPSLKSLKGCPKFLPGAFQAYALRAIANFKGAPERVAGGASLDGYKKSLEGIGFEYLKEVGGNLKLPPLASNVLGLALVKFGALTFSVRPRMDPEFQRTELLHDIVNKYAGKGRAAMLDFQHELIDNGFDEHAQP